MPCRSSAPAQITESHKIEKCNTNLNHCTHLAPHPSNALQHPLALLIMRWHGQRRMLKSYASKMLQKKLHQILKPLPITFWRAFCHHFVSILGPLSLPSGAQDVRSASRALPDALRDAFWSYLESSWGVLERPWAVLERSAPFAGSLQGLGAHFKWFSMFRVIEFQRI